MLNEIAENDPFADFESTAEVFAFVHHKLGQAGVRELLALTTSEPPAKPWLLTEAERVSIATSASLEGTARELDSAGLKKLAKIVREHATSRPSEADLSPYEPGTINYRAWLAGLKRRKR